MVEIAGQVVTAVDIGLALILEVICAETLKVKIVEKNNEAFLFVMGAVAVTITTGVVSSSGTHGWRLDLVELAAVEPIVKGIVPAVLIAGLIFFYAKGAFKSMITGVANALPMPVLVFVIVFVCGMISSVITAIVTSLFLVEIINVLPMSRGDKINLDILACFSIGLGAVLTPLGEPLSTIAITKLQGAPYHATFWYLFDQLGVLVILGCIISGVAAAVMCKKGTADVKDIAEEGGLREVIVRAVKVYVFVFALFLLGDGMNVLIDKYFTHIPSMVLYWVNIVSAILDNATLTSAELSPAMSQAQINAALMGLLIFGGCLIPGNIPNIISAGKLGITSSEYAKLGVPFGIGLGLVFFVLIYFVHFSPALNL